MAFNKGFTTSYNRDETKYNTWSTPSYLYQSVDKEFGFTLDVCASPENAKCKNYFTQEQDGLKQKWVGVCWMNPPYGSGVIDKWMKKAYESSLQGVTVVCLVPASTSTRWWHNLAMLGEIRFIKGKIKFIKDGKVGNPSPFHSALVIFRPKGVVNSAA